MSCKHDGGFDIVKTQDGEITDAICSDCGEPLMMIISEQQDDKVNLITEHREDIDNLKKLIGITPANSNLWECISGQEKIIQDLRAKLEDDEKDLAEMTETAGDAASAMLESQQQVEVLRGALKKSSHVINSVDSETWDSLESHINEIISQAISSTPEYDRVKRLEEVYKLAIEVVCDVDLKYEDCNGNLARLANEVDMLDGEGK